MIEWIFCAKLVLSIVSVPFLAYSTVYSILYNENELVSHNTENWITSFTIDRYDYLRFFRKSIPGGLSTQPPFSKLANVHTIIKSSDR